MQLTVIRNIPYNDQYTSKVRFPYAQQPDNQSYPKLRKE